MTTEAQIRGRVAALAGNPRAAIHAAVLGNPREIAHRYERKTGRKAPRNIDALAAAIAGQYEAGREQWTREVLAVRHHAKDAVEQAAVERMRDATKGGGNAKSWVGDIFSIVMDAVNGQGHFDQGQQADIEAERRKYQEQLARERRLGMVRLAVLGILSVVLVVYVATR